MPEEDHDTLAAEYVLGTLSAQEREQAEALRSFDPGFEAAVRQWERRLGELNVMVEAVEPPPETWDKIKTKLGSVAPRGETALPRDPESLPPVAGLAADALPGMVEPPPAATPQSVPSVGPAPGEVAAPSPASRPGKVERDADEAGVARRLSGWRRATLALAALAALLALYVAAWQVAPDRMPNFLRPHTAMTARSASPARSARDRLVAVLQQEPTSPAFLVTIDMQRRTLTARRVAATPESGKSYELWVISRRFPAPRSLGIVGNDEFTERAVPQDYDADTLSAASYEVSLEPPGGSTRGVPSGPILFTGKAVESLPSMPSASAKPPGT
jgi:anti-sigma-K factor RskA